MSELELLFFDTFSHENNEEINLDLVQFPKPVFIGEVRVIPLGARVQADFPGGVRLGATNPSQFKIEFFVNDLSKPSASTFENLGSIDYNQNGNIHLECDHRQIPTDGLVLKGWYTTITLAVYGVLTKTIVPEPKVPLQHEQELATADWVQQHAQESSGRGSYSDGTSQQYVGYPQGYPPQQHYPRHHYPWSSSQQVCENYDAKDSYDVENWDNRHNEKHWERNKERHQEHFRYERGHEEHSPEYREREMGEYDSRGREGGGYYQREWEDWQQAGTGGPVGVAPPIPAPGGAATAQAPQQAQPQPQQQAASVDSTPPPPAVLASPPGPSPALPAQRKRPHTPPPTPNQQQLAKSSPKSDSTPQHNDESGRASAGGFESMSPGDVESISEGDIPEPETGLSPSHTGDEGGEPFEPILSDEDIAEEGDHQDMDYDFGEYSEDPLRSFNPYNNEIKLLQNLEDPALTPYEYEVKNNMKKDPAGAEAIEKLLCAIPSCKESKEAWVESVEQLVNLIPKALSSVADSKRDGVIDKLIEWAGFGLDFQEAFTQPQPVFKVRHIKAGVRLVEVLAKCGEDVCLRTIQEAKAQELLLNLHQEEYMALSIKLMILRSLDATLRYKSCVEHFLNIDKMKGKSGYQRLVSILEEKNHARVKYAMSSVVCKLNFYELLTNLHDLVEEIRKSKIELDENIDHISTTLDKILKIFIDSPRLISHPKRFLPVSAQFELTNSFPDPYKALYSYFKFSNLLENFIKLLNHSSASCHSQILAPINGLISELIETNDGLKFLLSSENINILIRLLLGMTSTNENEIGRPGVNPTLGLHAAYRLQVLSFLDSLSPLADVDPNKPQVLDILHGMFSLTLSNVGNIGKLSVVHVLSQGENMDILLNFLKHKSTSRKRSPSRGYICDLIILTVKLSTYMQFFQKYVEKLLPLVNDFPELNEISTWLKPLENPSVFSYDNILPICEYIKSNVENCVNIPGDLIMAVRLLRFLGIPSHDRDLSTIPLTEDYAELKYKCVILQLYSADGCSLLTSILQQLCDHYDQPALHSASLIGRQGLMLLAFVHPAVQLLRRMLTYVIRVRNTEFKDLTAVPVLLKVYNLMQMIPINAQAHTDALRVCREIIESLLAYTQPVSNDTSSEADSLNKSLWTSMVSEVIQFCFNTPHNFISGLMVLSELLPLPLPLQTRQALHQEEASRFVSARKMWSAHLHSLNPAIESLIGTLGVSSYQPLLQILRRVCVQLADLAAPSALMVVRTFLDSISLQIQNDIKNLQLARLLNILACLMAHGPVKAAFLNLMKGKDEKYTNLLSNLLDIFKGPSEAPSQCQEYFALIIQSLCDSEVSLVPSTNSSTSVTNDIFLANALPPKDLLVLLIQSMLEHITNSENNLSSIYPVVRTFVLLTEHDYTYHHFKTCLEKKKDAILQVFTKISKDWSRESHDSPITLGVLLQLCRGVYAGRGGYFLDDFVLWKRGDHPLYNIETALKNGVQDDETLEPLLDEVSALIKLLNEEYESKHDQKELLEVLLPSADSLLCQFSLRQVWVIVDTDDDRLSSAYWLSPPNMHDVDTHDAGQAIIDLFEVAKTDIPDLSLPEAVGRLCSACPTPGEMPAVREAKKRNTESSGTKRPYVAVMRGRGFRRGDMFRSRPPNTSRPPSLHVDDFVALETCGAQPTGPTGYNKASMRAAQDLMVSRGRGRGRTFGGDRGGGRFFGSPTAFHRDIPGGESIWGEMYGASTATGAERRGVWAKEARGTRARNLRFFSR